MLVPTTTSEYNTYAASRSNLALPVSSLRPINVTNTPGRTFGIHPSMVNIQSLFNQGKAAFVANVGSLVAPMTKDEYYNETVTQPIGLFSHSDQQMHWQTGFASKRDSVGWAGRISDLLTSCNTNLNVPLNISFGGSNLLQTGVNSVEYTINTWNPQGGIDSDEPYNWWYSNMKKNTLTNMLDATYTSIFEQTYKNTIKKSRAAIADVSAALTAAPQFNGVFSSNYLSDAFKITAQLIATQSTLGMSRQIFFIDYGGWDHHDELLANQTEMLGMLDSAIGEFQTALNSINKADDVVTFSLSEFSRTLTSNGNGTDHAWGANVMVIGNPVIGQKIYGDYPSLALGGPLEVGGGVLIPTTAAEEYFAEIALWFGVPSSNLLDLYPNLPNFYSVGATHPMGFLNF
jgi:uncharacterized protein (DUF1501 family)